MTTALYLINHASHFITLGHSIEQGISLGFTNTWNEMANGMQPTEYDIKGLTITLFLFVYTQVDSKY